MKARAIFSSLFVVACSKGKPTPDPASGAGAPDKSAPSSRTARPQPKLSVTYDGKPVVMQTAVAWKKADGSVTFALSSLPLACEDLVDGAHQAAPGERVFGLVAGPALRPDGSIVTMQRYARLGNFARQELRPIQLTGDAAVGESTTAQVEFSVADAAAERTLVVAGTIDALGCRPAEVPALPPEMAATLEVAGKKLAIRGARITHGTPPDLVLTTGGEACDAEANRLDSEFELRFSWMDAAKPWPSNIALAGELIGKQLAVPVPDANAITIKPQPIAPGPLAIQVDLDVFDYRVKVTGTVTAVSCPQ